MEKFKDEFDIDTFINKLRDQEHLVMERAEDVRVYSQIVADDRNLNAALSGDIPCKKQLREHQVHVSETCKQNLEEKEDLDFKSLCLEMKTKLIQMLDDYAKNTSDWAEIFSSGPMKFHVDNISLEIENLKNEVDSLKRQLVEDMQPKIAEAVLKLQQETITIMDIPGFSPSELKNKDLQKLIERIQDSLKENEKSVVENELELKDLKAKESILWNI